MMRVALAQQNYIVGNIDFNKNQIIDAINKAKQESAQLVVFSQLSICGYPPFDLLRRATFVTDCMAAIDEIAGYCKGITAIVGAPSVSGTEISVLNSAYVLSDGEAHKVSDKEGLRRDLLTAEVNYFEPGKGVSVIEVAGKRIAVSVGDDYLNFDKESKKVDLAVVLSASLFTPDEADKRYKTLSGFAKYLNSPVVNVNQVGANTDLIFRGASMVVNANGFIGKQLESFSEDFALLELNSDELINSRSTIDLVDYIAQIHDALVLGIKDYFWKSGFSKATLGLSGGLDSAVVLALAQDALGSENLKVLLLPSQFSSQHSIDDAIGLADNLGVEYQIVSIEESFGSITEALKPVFGDAPADLTEENIQARIRGLMLMALSNKQGYLLLNTSNKSEAAVGYGTLYGDMNGALAVLADVYKSDVFKLAYYINRSEEIIPINTITKPPSAELRPEQKDSDSLPDYDILDAIIYEYVENEKSALEIMDMNFDQKIVKRIIRLINSSEHKRAQSAPVLRVSKRGFGLSRRFPLVGQL